MDKPLFTSVILTMERCQVKRADQADILSNRRIRPHVLSIWSYDHFIELLFSEYGIYKRSPYELLTWYFVHRQIAKSIECAENFSPNEYFLLEILHAQEKLILSVFLYESGPLLEQSTSQDDNIRLSWHFQHILTAQRSVCRQNTISISPFHLKTFHCKNIFEL
jgi:hypothetical protein